MSLQAGERLGPYEVVRRIGAGGMGEVYQARDTRLHRDVALKVLPTGAASDPERVERFEREARAAAALNHPNNHAVHDIGYDRTGPFIVSELLQGATLRGHSPPGRPWPPARVLDLAVQVAQGLAAAHARGIIHRDLKPENIFVSDDGVVRILDFGLARLTEPVGPSDGQETLTRDGAPLGTVGYMAPEQVRGQTVDARTDIFAFGAVIHELLSGERTFAGDSTADAMLAVLSKEPRDLADLSVPSPFARIVARCLEKRPDARFQSASDLAFALKGVASSDAFADRTARVVTPAIERVPPRVPHPVLLLMVALSAGAIGFYWATRGARRSSTQPVAVAHRLTELAGLEEAPAISPDGKAVAFTATLRGRRQIFVRLIAGGAALQISSGDVDHVSPRWSPDSSTLAYFSPARSDEPQGTLWEVSALGGAPRRLGSAVSGADISRVNDRLAYFRLEGARVELVTSARDGSDAQTVAQFEPALYLLPRWSPDARRIAYLKGDGVRFDVFAMPAAGGEVQQLTQDHTPIGGLAWLPDNGGIIYSTSRESAVPYLPPFSLWEARLGAPAPRQITAGELSYLDPDVREDGSIVVSRMRMNHEIWKFPTGGDPGANVRNAERITRQTGQVLTPTLAPDDMEMAFLSDSGGHMNLWVMAAESGALRQITHERDPAISVGVPIWSPDGRSIAFVSSREDHGLGFGIWLVNPDGSELRQLVPRGLGAAWSHDGRWVYYVERAGSALMKIAVDGGQALIVREEATRNVIGSDGSALYYTVERRLVDGKPEFEIRAATPEDGPSRLLSRIPGVRVPRWQILNPALSPDGRSMAQPLTDGVTTNIWLLSTTDGQWRQLTDFGDRVTFVARRVSWSADSRYVIAAVAEGDADIVRLSGLLSGRRE